MRIHARHLARSRRVAAGSIFALAIACAAHGGAVAGGGTGTSGSEEARAASGQFTPSSAPAPAYGADVGRCPGGGAIREVLGELEAAAKKSGRVPVTADSALCAVAEAFLRWDASEGTPRPAVLAFVSEWFGLPTPVLPPSMAVIETEDTRVIAERIVQAIGNSALNAVHPRLGLATQRVKRGATKVVVVLADAPIEIAPPFPKRLDLGQKATLSGRLLSGLRSPRVQVSDATGKLSTPEQGPGEAFKADVACGTQAGRIIVEIRGEYEGRAGVVANFPVRCGTEMAGGVAIAPEHWPTAPPEAEKRMLELVNEERAAVGLSVLKWDAAVAGVARGISEDLSKGIGGVDVADRMKREGIASSLILQSAAAERSFERAHERLVSNPSNRANIMSPDVTSIGIGALAKTDADGKPLVFVTELFTKELPPVDLAKVRQDLKAAVARKRRDARTSPLTVEPLLDEAAQQYAQALAVAGGNLSKERYNELVAPLTKSMRTLSILSGAKPEPLDFAEEPQVTAVAKVVGVGTASGRHAVLGRNATYVVIMVGTLRNEPAEAKPGVTGSRRAKPTRKP